MFYCFSLNFVYIINRKIHGCLEIPDLIIVLNTQNKSGISAHSCIILYIFYMFSNHNRPMYKYCVFLRRVVTIFDTIGTARLPVYIAWVLSNSL